MTENAVTPVTRGADYGRNHFSVGENVLKRLMGGKFNYENVNVSAYMKENYESLT